MWGSGSPPDVDGACGMRVAAGPAGTQSLLATSLGEQECKIAFLLAVGHAGSASGAVCSLPGHVLHASVQQAVHGFVRAVLLCSAARTLTAGEGIGVAQANKSSPSLALWLAQQHSRRSSFAFACDEC
jgi:hypothetical protein